MSLSWIFGLLWARKFIVLITTVGALLGGVTVLAVAPPRYKATARVVLEFIKPDPLSGIYIHNNRQAEEYIRTQLQRVTDYQVVIPAAAALGWLDNPDMAAAYAARPANDRREYSQWVAAGLMSTTTATMVPGSNIMQIEHRAESPELATAVVEALRQAYIDAGVEERRQSAQLRADAIVALSAPMQAKVDELEKQKADYAHATGVILERDNDNPANRTLFNLAKSEDRVVVERPMNVTEAQEDLMRLEAQLATAQETLGPNNPQLIQLRRQRDLVAAAVEAERGGGRAMMEALAAQVRHREQQLAAQKAKVLDERDEVLQLRLYQDQIDRYRETLAKWSETVAEMRALSTSTAAGASAMGPPALTPRPVFPNPPLILLGSSGLGFLLGALLALLAELVHRRVRTPHDLELAADQPILGIVPHASIRGIARRQRRRRKAAQATQVAAETLAA